MWSKGEMHCLEAQKNDGKKERGELDVRWVMTYGCGLKVPNHNF